MKFNNEIEVNKFKEYIYLVQQENEHLKLQVTCNYMINMTLNVHVENWKDYHFFIIENVINILNGHLDHSLDQVSLTRDKKNQILNDLGNNFLWLRHKQEI